MSLLDDLKKKYDQLSLDRTVKYLKGESDSPFEPQQEVPVSNETPTPSIAPSMMNLNAGRAPSSFTPDENQDLVSDEQTDGTQEPPVEDASEQLPEQDKSQDNISPEMPPKNNVLDFGKGTDYRQQLADAQEQSKTARLIARLGQASDSIGSGIAGGTSGRSVSVKPTGEAFYKDLEAGADQPIKDLQQRMSVEKESPSEAQGLKDFLKSRFGLDIQGNPTPEQLQKLLPTLSHLKGLEITGEARKDAAKQTQDFKNEVQEQKKTDKLNKDVVDLQKALDPTQARSGEFAKQYSSLMQGEKLKALTTKAGTGLNLTPQELEEFSLGLGRLISGSGGAARSQIEALVPHSIVGNAAKTVQWLSNEPTGTQQQEFVKRMLGTVDREQDIARRELKKTIEKRHNAYSGKFKDDDSGIYDNTLNDALDSLGLNNKIKRTPSSESSTSNEVKRITKDGRVAIFDPATKQFLRYE